MSTARIIIDASESNADLYYLTRFLAPDAFIYIEVDGRSMLVMNDLELDRARTQAKVDAILSYSAVAKRAYEAGIERPTMIDVVVQILKEHEVDHVEVPSSFGLLYADKLRAKGYDVEPIAGSFVPERAVKTPEEVAHIRHALKATEEALASAIQLISESTIGKEDVLQLAGKPLTSELLRKTMHLTLMEQGLLGQHTIVAGGEHGVDPHQEGFGPLKAHLPIVMDVFPQDMASRYFADLSRTVVRGDASEKVKGMFNAVKDGQDLAFASIKPGANGADIHKAILDMFEERGFKTGIVDGRMQGFFHGTGHGVGVEIHEMPRIGGVPDILEAGHIVTVEPGLYYAGVGGMRLEDMVLVTDDGCEVLNQLPKVLEV